MTKETIEKLKKITRENSTSVQYVNAQIELFEHYYYSLIDPKTAIEYLSNITQEDDEVKYGFVQSTIGNIYYQEEQLQNLKLAKSYWENALKINANFSGKERVKLSLSILYLIEKDINAAITLLESVNNNIDYPKYFYDMVNSNLAFLYFKNGEKDKAVQKWIEFSTYYEKNNFEHKISFQLYVYTQLYLFTYENEEKYIHDLYKKNFLFDEFKLNDYVLDLFKDIFSSNFYFELSKIFCDIALIRDELLIDVSNSLWERKLAHYTNTEVINSLLSATNSHLRLNNIYNMNDPTEGIVINSYIGMKDENSDKTEAVLTSNIEYVPFIACFTFNHDSLNQFRLYGKTNNQEATGVSLVLSENFFGIDLGLTQSIRMTHKLDVTDIELINTKTLSQAVYRCIYIDPKTNYISIAKRNKSTFYREYRCGQQTKNLEDIEIEWINYSNFINEKEKRVNELLNNLKDKIEKVLLNDKHDEILRLINLSLLPLKFLVKHIAFEDEQECRICYISSLKDKNIVMDFQKQWLFIDYPAPVKPNLKYIYVATGAKKFYPFIIKLMDGQSDKVKISDNPFRIN